MHNHLPTTRCRCGRSRDGPTPWLHNKHWPDANTYTESITEPAWVYAKACPEALLAYVQVRAMAGGATAVQGWPTANRGYRTVMRNVDAEQVEQRQRRPDLHLGGHQDRRRARDGGSPDGRRRRVHLPLRRRAARLTGAARLHRPRQPPKGCCRRSSRIHCCAVDAGELDASGPRTNAGGVVWSPLSNLAAVRPDDPDRRRPGSRRARSASDRTGGRRAPRTCWGR